MACSGLTEGVPRRGRVVKLCREDEDVEDDVERERDGLCHRPGLNE